MVATDYFLLTSNDFKLFSLIFGVDKKIQAPFKLFLFWWQLIKDFTVKISVIGTACPVKFCSVHLITKETTNPVVVYHNNILFNCYSTIIYTGDEQENGFAATTLLTWFAANQSTCISAHRVEHPRVVLRKGHIGVSFYFIFAGSVFVNVEELLTKTGHVMWHTAITLYRGDSFGVSNDITVSKIIAFQKVNSLEVLSSLRGPLVRAQMIINYLLWEFLFSFLYESITQFAIRPIISQVYYLRYITAYFKDRILVDTTEAIFVWRKEGRILFTFFSSADQFAFCFIPQSHRSLLCWETSNEPPQ